MDILRLLEQKSFVVSYDIQDYRHYKHIVTTYHPNRFPL
jgi:hypothetical protein